MPLGSSAYSSHSLRSLIDPVLGTGPNDEQIGEHLSFSFDYLAVFMAAWTGGFWPAIVTAIISALVSNFFFTDPYLSLAIGSIEELFDTIFFAVVSVVIGVSIGDFAASFVASQVGRARRKTISWRRSPTSCAVPFLRSTTPIRSIG